MNLFNLRCDDMIWHHVALNIDTADTEVHGKFQFLPRHYERRIFLRLGKREARVFKILFIASIDPDADDEFLLIN